jgi:hypothetical protein
MKFFISTILFFVVSIVNAASVGDAEQLLVIEQNELLWEQCNITVTSSTGKKNRITVINCINKTAMAASFQFARQIVDALKHIQSIGVGNLLLEDVAQDECNDLVIFNTNLYDTILKEHTGIIKQFERGEDKGAHKQMIEAKIPSIVKEWFLKDQAMQLDDFLYNSRNYHCFSNAVATKFSKNIIFVGFCPLKIISYKTSDLFSKPDVTLNKENNANLPLHIHLFHELNHYRHYKSRIGTCGEDGSYLSTKNGEEISLDNIGISRISDKKVPLKFKPKMKNSEEELQQIGYTITVHGKTILDQVNETYYRIQNKMDGRFPYNETSGFEITDSQTVYVISSEELIYILMLPIIDKRPIASCVLDLIFSIK